ncbi:hypothetical protein GOBAR_DD25025 [Gossypium barbadense]|nr:hypothetical protein GOBAR_DD25025 [Gossypium barbadense]
MERTTTFCFKFSTSADPGLGWFRINGGSNENETFSCGVVLDDGSICKRPPVEGRKRCAEHKGKKTTGSSMRLSMKSQPHKEDYPEIEHCSPICGVAMDDGSLCRRQPVSGRKGYKKSPSHVFDSSSSLNSNNCSTPICGVPTSNGTPCKRTAAAMILLRETQTMTGRVHPFVEHQPAIAHSAGDQSREMEGVGSTDRSRQVTTPLLFKLIPAVVCLGVLLRWFPADSPEEIVFESSGGQREAYYFDGPSLLADEVLILWRTGA